MTDEGGLVDPGRQRAEKVLGGQDASLSLVELSMERKYQWYPLFQIRIHPG